MRHISSSMHSVDDLLKEPQGVGVEWFMTNYLSSCSYRDEISMPTNASGFLDNSSAVLSSVKKGSEMCIGKSVFLNLHKPYVLRYVNEKLLMYHVRHHHLQLHQKFSNFKVRCILWCLSFKHCSSNLWPRRTARNDHKEVLQSDLI